MIFFDCEVYKNYFLVTFKNDKNNKVSNIDFFGENATLNTTTALHINNLLLNSKTCGFNSNNYDIPVLKYAMAGKNCLEIYQLSKHIIQSGERIWEVCNKFNLYDLYYEKHIDIKEPTPATNTSLKQFASRMHCKNLQDLPYDPHKLLTKEETQLLKKYCLNDIIMTEELFQAIIPRLKLRRKLSDIHGVNLMSKSDAQIADKLVNIFVSKKVTINHEKGVAYDKDFKYIAPKFLKFKSDEFNELLNTVTNITFKIKQTKYNKKSKKNEVDGEIVTPEELKKGAKPIKFGHSSYKVGMGGLHSQENYQTITPNNDQLLIDKDVTSYYPSLMLKNGYYPPQLTSQFLQVYQDLVTERLKAKHSGDNITSDGLKIAINGAYGKLNSVWSNIYHPPTLIQITLTGQLSLLMLVEQLEMSGISVVSANTDGVVSLVNKKDYKLFEQICDNWQRQTSLNLEDTYYSALYSVSVSDYLAVTTDQKVKKKGKFGNTGLSKNCKYEIVFDALYEYLVNGVEVEQTVKNCKDIKKFMCMSKVKNGGIWRGQMLGKTVRWIYSHNGEEIRDSVSNNKVSESSDALALLQLPTKIPTCINYDIYIEKAKKHIKKFENT